MSADGGQVVVQLVLEDGQYRVGVMNAGTLMREFQRNVNQTATSVKKLEDHTQSAGRRFRDLVLTLGNLRFVAMDVNDIFLRLPLAILKSAGEIEKMKQLMVGLSKETNRARREAEGLSNFKYVIGTAKNAPFELKALADSFVKLKSAGIDPTNGSMQALVDSVARFGGSDEQLKRASIAIQQMSGKGVVSMEELRQQLGEAVPTAMRSMAEGMEISMADLAKAVSTGTVEAGPAISRMLARMAVENDQAAQEMMKTWVGALSRLKTEWQLTATQIADAGLGGAAKDAVKEITEALQGAEFRDFATSVGFTLGDFVRTTTDAVRWVVTYREEIGLLIKAFVAYKVATSLILPGLRSIESAQIAVTKAVRGEIAAGKLAQANYATMRGDQIQMAQASLAASQANHAQTVRFIADREAELVAVRARNAQILAADRALTAQMAFSGGVRIPGTQGFQSRAAGAAELARLAAANSVQIAQERALTAQLTASRAALALNTAAVARHTAALGSMTYATRAQMVASTLSAGAMRAGNAVMNLMGGPVGVAIAAIMLLVYAYNKLTGAANEAREAERRQKQNASTDEDLSSLKDAVEKKRKDQAGLQKALEGAEKTTPGQRPNTGYIEKLKKAMSVGAAELNDLESKLSKTAVVVHERLVEEEAGALANSNRRMVNAHKDGTAAEVRAIRETRDAKLKTLREGSPEWLKVSNEFNARENQTYKNGRLKLAGNLEESAKAVNASVARAQREGTMTNVQLDALRASAKTSSEQADAIRQELGNFDVRMPNMKPPKSPKTGEAAGPREGRIEQLMETLKSERAALDAELEVLTTDATSRSSVEAKVAKLRAQLATNDFAGVSPEQKSAAVDLAKGNAERDDRTAKIRADAVEIDKIASFLNGRAPEIDQAMELLRDPLGTNTAGADEKKTKRFLEKNIDALKIYAEKMGLTIEQVKAEAIKGSWSIDDAKDFGDMARETKTLNDSLVDDSRDAAKQRTDAENERHRVVMQNIIIERAAKGLPADEVAKLQAMLNENAAARAGDAAKKFESPLDKLAANWRNTTKNMEEASVGWANSTSQALTDLVMTGKGNFAELAKSIIADLIKIQIQKALTGAVNAATDIISTALAFIPFAEGGVMTSMGSVPLKKYAAGGIANSPQMALFGEGRVPEAYVPLADGRTIPVTMKGQGGGGNVEINIHVTKTGDSTSSAGDDATKYRYMGERIRQVVREEMVDQQRPGGSLYK